MFTSDHVIIAHSLPVLSKTKRYAVMGKSQIKSNAQLRNVNFSPRHAIAWAGYASVRRLSVHLSVRCEVTYGTYFA